MTEPRPRRRSTGRAITALFAVWSVLPAAAAFVTVDVEPLRSSPCWSAPGQSDPGRPAAPLEDRALESEEDDDERTRHRMDAADEGSRAVSLDFGHRHDSGARFGRADLDNLRLDAWRGRDPPGR